MGVNGFDLLGGFGSEGTQLRVILVVQIAVVLGNANVDLTAGFGVRRRELFSLVVTLGAPGDVVGVAEGVDIQDVDVGGGKEEVLD